MSAVALRPIMPEDERRARALVRYALANTRYLVRVEQQLDAALSFEDPEYMALLAIGEPGQESPAALALFGAVAGARQCVKVHALLGDDVAMRALAAGIVQVCEQSGERLALCELPDDAPWASTAAALLASGFVEEGRVMDYIRDGLSLRLLVWRMAR